MIPAAGTLLCLGLADRDEFRPLRDRLFQLTEPTRWQTAATLVDFLAQRPRTPVEFAVIWQSGADEFTAGDVTRLLAALPLCRVVCVTGAWCDALPRTRRAWPVGLVVPWWRAWPRLQREWQALCEGGGDLLPWTASREEAWLWQQAGETVARLDGLRLAMDMSDAAFAATLRDLFRTAGADIVTDQPDVVLVDADPWNADRAAVLTTQIARIAPTPVVAFSAWTTPEVVAECLATGIAAIVPKLDPTAWTIALAEVSHAANSPAPQGVVKD
jgi:CheY-like chemotaxis protein